MGIPTTSNDGPTNDSPPPPVIKTEETEDSMKTFSSIVRRFRHTDTVAPVSNVRTTRSSARMFNSNSAQVKMENEDTQEAKVELKAEEVEEMKHPIVQKASKKRKLDSDGAAVAPANWEEIYGLVKHMRTKVSAPVDTMGCERLADNSASEKDQRFQTLIALMLSSQTKDTVTAVAMANMRKGLPGGLTLQSILDVSSADLDNYIRTVGFHNRKTEYIKKTALILKEKYNGDIPDTIEGLTSLPGVGPKMAYLCLSAAWNRTEGIGVDVHVHRITNLWKWNNTSTPEATRAALESWLPRDKWREINWLLVGFGQTICLPRTPKCNECSLAENRLCPAASKFKRATKKVKVKEIKLEPDSTAAKVEELSHEAKSETEYKPDLKYIQDIEDAVLPSPKEEIEQPKRRKGRKVQ